MKHIIALLMAAAITVSAADAPKKSVFDGVTFSPVGVLKTEHLDGPSQWGAGFDLGKAINPFVSIHVVNLGFEGAGQETIKTKNGLQTTGENDWGGLLVDETALQIDAQLSSFSKEKFSLHLVAGGQTDWNDNDYGINAGLRADLALHKHVSLSAGYSIRTWFKNETRVDSLATLALNLKF